jgi:hypothetical protein
MNWRGSASPSTIGCATIRRARPARRRAIQRAARRLDELIEPSPASCRDRPADIPATHQAAVPRARRRADEVPAAHDPSELSPSPAAPVAMGQYPERSTAAVDGARGTAHAHSLPRPSAVARGRPPAIRRRPARCPCSDCAPQLVQPNVRQEVTTHRNGAAIQHFAQREIERLRESPVRRLNEAQKSANAGSGVWFGAIQGVPTSLPGKVLCTAPWALAAQMAERPTSSAPNARHPRGWPD